MKRNLINRLNLENDGEGTSLGDAQAVDGTLEVTQEAVIESVVAAQEGDEIVADAIQLESAFISLNNITQLAQNLEDAGVDSDIVAEEVAPAAIDAVAQIDEDLAEETEQEAVIALESDDKKSVWVRIKEKAKQIWEAIKANAAKFWVWLKSMFGNLKATAKKLESAAADLTKRISAAEDFTEAKLEVRNNWTIENKVPDIKDLTKSINGLATMNTRSHVFNKIAEHNEEIAGGLSAVKDSAERATALKRKITGMDLPAIIKAMNSEGHGFVGYSFKDGKYVSSKVEGGQIETGSKAELLTLVKAARKAAVVLGGLDSINARAETSIKAIQAEIDKLLAAKEVDPEVAREYQNLVNITATYITNGIRVLKIGVAENGVRAVGNVLSFANASLKAGTAEKKAA